LAGDGEDANRLAGLLNTATPYAATSEAEIRARLARAEPKPDDDEHLAEKADALPPLPSGERLYADFQAEPGDIPAADTEPGEFQTAPLTADQLTPRLARLALESDELQHTLTVRSADLAVTVVIDVAGRILDLAIAEDVHRTLHITQLSRSVVAAVNSARDQSDDIAKELAMRHQQLDR
jgi:hypothetical protein